ncbi:MAG TPA: tRNA (adenosine(37)-N6)-dimethylallyltransferase MiaA [Gemmatimonadales bacterium]|nr:tRNA (adenosine(37)-N6)-dimethylallyltransferase MiaA [Gemmatimonadales bacterium]
MAGDSVPVIAGPTGIGKTAVACALAAHWDLEIVSADSRQVYRRLDIGTAKPAKKWQARIPHHGLDLVEPGERYSAGRFARDATRWIEEIRARRKLPVVVGGTGLYIRALCEGLFAEPPLDPVMRKRLSAWTGTMAVPDLVRWAGRLDPGYGGGGRQRAERAIEVALLSGRPLSFWQTHARKVGTVDPWYVVLTAPRAVLQQRIEARARDMVQQGMIEEVAAVLADGVPPDAAGLDAIGMREAVDYLQGRRTRESVAEAVSISTRQYAKRQSTWFRHQLEGEVLTLDATRPAEELAAEIAAAWQKAISLKP